MGKAPGHEFGIVRGGEHAAADEKQEEEREDEADADPCPVAARPDPAQGEDRTPQNAGDIGGARKGDQQRVERQRGDEQEKREHDAAATQKQREDERQGHRDIKADIAAAQMHARERRNDAIAGVEIESAGKCHALGERGQRDERQSGAHPHGEPAQHVGALAHRAGKERQQRQRRHKSFGQPQRIVGPQIDDVRAARRAGQRQSPRRGDDAGEQRRQEHRAGKPGEKDIGAPGWRAQRQHANGDQDHEIGLGDGEPAGPGRQIEGRQRCRQDGKPHERPAP